MNDINGILVVNKPAGFTSHDVVAKLRNLLHIKKIGHTGTLDPNVTGVLPVCIGSATKAAPFLVDKSKTYQGQLILGLATDTEDLDGKVLNEIHLKEFYSDKTIIKNMQKLVGDIKQIPPMYSAVKVNGKKLYEYARNGENVERPIRQIHVNSFEFIKSFFNKSIGQQIIEFKVDCSKGTYVRTLVTQLGELLNVPAVMKSLVRIRSGQFTLNKSLTLENIEEKIRSKKIMDYIFSLDQIFTDYPKVNLSMRQWEKVKNGGFLKLDLDSKIVCLTYSNKVKAIYQQYKDGYFKPLKMFLNNN